MFTVILTLLNVVLLISGIMFLFRKKLNPAIRVPSFLLCAVVFLPCLLWEGILVRNDQKERGSIAFIKNIIENQLNPQFIVSYSSDITSDEKKQAQDAISNFPRCNYKVNWDDIWPGGEFFLFRIFFNDGKTFLVSVDVRGGKYAIRRLMEVNEQSGKAGAATNKDENDFEQSQ